MLARSKMSSLSKFKSEAQQEPPLPSHLVPLDLSSFQTCIPESHWWPESDVSSRAVEQLPIPLIDLKDSSAAMLMGNACENWGVFQLINHGVPETLIAKAENETRRLFDLPATQKLKALRSPTDISGYGMFGVSKFHSKAMWSEGFNILGSPIDHAKALWPTDFKRFCDAIEEYRSKMKALAEQLISLILKFLGISDEELMRNLIASSSNESGAGGSHQPYTALRLNSYPPCPDPSRVMGLAAHTDTSLFTILHQSHAYGLQIFKDGVGWLTVSPVAGTLVVNVGDLLHILSNGRFPSVLHRVVIKGEEQRVSLAYFYDPPYDWYISPYCKPLSDSPQIPIYRSVTVKEFFSMKAKNMGKGLPLIKI